MLSRIVIFLIGSHYYYPYLFFKVVNKDTTPKIGAVLFTAKNVGALLVGVYYLLSGDNDPPQSKSVFILSTFVLGLLVSYIYYIKINAANYIIKFFEEKISKKIIPIGIIYVLAIDFLTILFFIDSLPELK